MPISLLWTVTDDVFGIVAAVRVGVGTVVSMVTDRAPERAAVSPATVAEAVIDFVPAVSVAVVQFHTPVVVLAVHVLPEFVPSTFN